MKHSRALILSVLLASAGLAAALLALPAHAANETVTVNFALNGGTPTYRASGFIYGVSQNAATPATSNLSSIKTRFMRGGGSQIGLPNGGWVNGQFAPRWDFVRAYYAKARSVGATYIMILAPLWGSDGPNNVPRWPGDNGNWTEFNAFLDQVIGNARANGMTGSDVRWDIWNEPDIFFWSRSQSQYFEMWRRAVQRIRAALPNSVIEGPSFAFSPGSGWWPAYLDYIRDNNVVPNIMSAHALPGDPVTHVDWMKSALAARGITSVSGFSINEYGAFGDEQQPGPSAWYIARLERANGGTDGARANWGMVGQTPSLYATLGWLMTPNNQPMGQWWVYKRYGDQTGLRTDIQHSASIDGIVFQDASAERSISVLGKRVNGGTGIVTVRFNNVPAFLRSSANTTRVLLERMPSTNAFVSAPTQVSNSQVAVVGNSIVVSINWSNALDAYAITLTR